MTSFESDSVEIIREALACARNPVMLLSGGKESTVLLHLVRKACFPAPIRIPLLHIDSGWEFPETSEHVLAIGRNVGVQPLVHRNESRRAKEVGPFTHGREICRRVLNHEPLVDALDKHGFDVVLGGGRLSEVGVRIANEVLLFLPGHRLDQRGQRMAFWGVHDCRVTRGGTARVFPLSNWSELDVWRYVFAEDIRVNPMYFAASRRVIKHSGQLIVLPAGHRVAEARAIAEETRLVRLRKVGCWPFSTAIASEASSVPDVLTELAGLAKTVEADSWACRGENASAASEARLGYF